MALLARVGFAKEGVWRDVFARCSYDALLAMREGLEREIKRRQPAKEEA